MSQDFTHLLEAEIGASLTQLEGDAPLLVTMARYHLGLVDPAGKPTRPAERTTVQGKRIRPQLAFQCCAAVGGDPVLVAPLAAAIELLHNFTLIHDDIQDRSPNRRHRATVWRVWGDAQAINAGDALFAMAQRTLLRTDAERVPATTLVRLMDEFNRATIEIVRGQVLDLEFERAAMVEPHHYLAMIKGKTAAIVRFAAWAGAVLGGAGASAAEQLAQFGEALGIGFQVQDDVLGIWGSLQATGKDPADDIRRRKKSLPILMLLERATPHELKVLTGLFDGEKVGEEGVATVLELLDRHGVREAATAQVAAFHRQAAASLESALATDDTGAGAGLKELIQRLDTRIS